VERQETEGKKRSRRKQKRDALADAHIPAGQAGDTKENTELNDLTKVKWKEKRKSGAKRNRDATLDEYSIPFGPAGAIMFCRLVQLTINITESKKSLLTAKGKGARSHNSCGRDDEKCTCL
jgi:hypothetical protein